MRYVLLGSTMMGASFVLPFVDMTATPKGQPVEAVEISVLDTSGTPDRADPTVALGMAPTMPMVGALWAADVIPFGRMAHMFSDGDTATAGAGPAAPPFLSMLPGAPQPQPAEVPGIEIASLTEVPAPEPAPQPLPVAEAPAPMPDLAPPAVLAAPPAAPQPEPEGTVIAAIPPETGVIETAFAAGDDALAPLTEDVGSLSLNDPAPVSLTLIEEEAPALAIETPGNDDAAPAVQADAPQQPAVAPDLAEAAGDDVMMMEVTASYLNLRAGPSSSHSVVFGLSRGAEAEVIEKKRNGWTRVRVPETGQEGWAYSRYLTEASDA